MRGLFKGIGPRVDWITVGGYVFFGAYEQAERLLWASGGWDENPNRRWGSERPPIAAAALARRGCAPSESRDSGTANRTPAAR